MSRPCFRNTSKSQGRVGTGNNLATHFEKKELLILFEDDSRALKTCIIDTVNGSQCIRLHTSFTSVILFFSSIKFVA